jgi:hypothetical protein
MSIAAYAARGADNKVVAHHGFVQRLTPVVHGAGFGNFFAAG